MTSLLTCHWKSLQSKNLQELLSFIFLAVVEQSNNFLLANNCALSYACTAPPDSTAGWVLNLRQSEIALHRRNRSFVGGVEDLLSLIYWTRECLQWKYGPCFCACFVLWARSGKQTRRLEGRSIKAFNILILVFSLLSQNQTCWYWFSNTLALQLYFYMWSLQSKGRLHKGPACQKQTHFLFKWAQLC